MASSVHASADKNDVILSKRSYLIYYKFLFK